MKKIILVADDFGISTGVNKAILDLWKKGIIQNTGILVEGSAFDDALKIIRENPTMEISCHLTASFKYPTLKLINSLTDKKGFFKRTSGFDINFEPNETELFNEFDAQINKLIKNGVIVSSINCHHNMQMYKGVQSAFLKIARKYKLPIRNVDNKIAKTKLENIEDVFGNQSFYKKSATLEQLRKIFSEMNANEVIDIQMHPGFSDKTLEQASSYNKERDLEYKLFNSDEFKKLLEKQNVSLVSYKNRKEKNEK